MTYQLFLACLDDTPSKGVGDFTVSCESTTIRGDVVNPVGEKRVSEHVISTVKWEQCKQMSLKHYDIVLIQMLS